MEDRNKDTERQYRMLLEFLLLAAVLTLAAAAVFPRLLR
jgi:hypothetical protein